LSGAAPSGLRQRVPTALVMLALVCLVLFALPSAATLVLILIAFLFGAWEWSAFVAPTRRGIRAAFVNIDWATLGAVLDTETLAILIEFGFTSIISGGTILATAATVNANVNANHNFGGRWSLSGTTYAIAPRYYNSAATIGTAVSSGTTAFSGNYSAAMVVGPGGQTTYMHAGALPTDPSGFGLGPRRYSQPVSTWTSGSLTYPAGPPKPAFWVEDAVCVWRKIRIMRWS